MLQHSMKNLSTDYEFLITKKIMLESILFILFYRGNKPISIATFSIATNPTDQFNIFKKYMIRLQIA